MAKILMIGNQKGGIGKTAVTVMTATALSQDPFNFNVVVIDLDRQKSVSKSRNYDLQAYEVTPESTPFKVLNYSLSDLQTNIGQLDKDNDLIFLDVGGYLDNTKPIEVQEVTKALMYVDCLFVPFVAGGYNLDSTLEYYEFIKQVQTLRAVQPRQLKVFGFVNMYRQRTKANSILNDEIQALTAKENLKMMQSSLNDYAAFKESDSITSLYDASHTEGAKANFTAWIDEFLNTI